MSNRIRVTIGGDTVEEQFSPQEQAEFDALQQSITAERESRIAALAAIPFDANDNAVDLAKALNYVQATNTFLALGTPTNAQVLAQVQRNAQALRAIIKLLIRGGA